MYKRESILDRLIDKFPENKLLRDMVNEILKYYEMDQFINIIPHYTIFRSLYSEVKPPYWKIAWMNHVHRDTVKRYVKVYYNVLAKNMIKADYIPGIRSLFLKEVEFYDTP